MFKEILIKSFSESMKDMNHQIASQRILIRTNKNRYTPIHTVKLPNNKDENNS